MIKFFRKIRQNMIRENRAFKYFMYAVGEILLVVIGILIALQINKWNIAKTDRSTETQALINLKVEFDRNHERLQKIIRIKQKQEDQGRAFLDIISNDEIPIQEKIKAKRPGGWNGTLGATNSVLESLLSTGDITKIQNDSLKYLLTNWSVDIARYEGKERGHSNALARRRDYLTDKHYGTIVKSGDHGPEWPGSYYPNNIERKNAELEELYFNDIEYYNHTRSVVGSTYILLINAKTISDNYEIVSRLIIQELESRNVDINQFKNVH